jgi:hypothetical protein
MTLSIQTQGSSLGLLITFVNNFQFDLVVMFVYFVNQSSVINLIDSMQLILLYKPKICKFYGYFNYIILFLYPVVLWVNLVENYTFEN